MLSHSITAFLSIASSATAMAPITPHWAQPSHPDIQQVVAGKEGEFSSKSLSRVTIEPSGLFASLTSPPCTFVDESTYATVQAGRNKHILLNSDLLYLNHSCEPSLVSAIIHPTPFPPPFSLTEGLARFVEWHKVASPFFFFFFSIIVVLSQSATFPRHRSPTDPMTNHVTGHRHRQDADIRRSKGTETGRRADCV